MDQKKKAKLVVLMVSVAVIAVAAGGIYYLTKKPQSPAELVGSAAEQPESFKREETTSDLTGSADTSETEEREGERETVKDNLILLEGGTFVMGSPVSERQRGEDETQHEVTVSPFYVDPFEVTQADYESIMGENPSHFSGDNLPVESVTWYDAVEYCNRLSENRGLTPAYIIEENTLSWNRSADGYRLLTEAEWEYAARAGTTTVFHDGDQITSDNANFEGSYPYLIEENYVTRRDPSVVTSANRGETIAVDSLSANGFGLYNMYGNVSEWCFDYYGTYDTVYHVDPAGAASGSLRVNRGGGYDDFAKQLRSAYRSAATPDTADQNLGFRIARNAQAGEGVVETVYALDIEMPESPRILVAYFSHTGNTQNGAEIIAQRLGADLFEIRMEHPYSGNIYEVSQADLNNHVFPALAAHVENMEQYDVVILGYPTWWSTMPMPVFTFLSEYDFSGKMILPFSSNGGTRFGDSISDLSKMVQGAYVGQGFQYFYSGGGTLGEELIGWLAENGIEAR